MYMIHLLSMNNNMENIAQWVYQFCDVTCHRRLWDSLEMLDSCIVLHLSPRQSLIRERDVCRYPENSESYVEKHFDD